MTQQEFVIPEAQTSVEPTDPLQRLAEELYSISSITVTDEYIALPRRSEAPGLRKILFLDKTGRFGEIHILDTSHDCIGCPRRVNSISRPDDTQAIAFAQQLHKIKPKTPELTDQRYYQALAAVKLLLTQELERAEAEMQPLLEIRGRAANGLTIVAGLEL